MTQLDIESKDFDDFELADTTKKFIKVKDMFGTDYLIVDGVVFRRTIK